MILQLERDGEKPAGRSDIENARGYWPLICPIWPSVLATINEQDRRSIERQALMISEFSGEERVGSDRV